MKNNISQRRLAFAKMLCLSLIVFNFGNAALYAQWNPVSSIPLSTAFSDTKLWNEPQYGTTIMFGDINGDGLDDVCGRGQAGIWCQLSTGTGFAAPFLAQSEFSDANHWDASVALYGTIRLADVEGNGRPAICGRNINGIVCARNLVNSPVDGHPIFGGLEQWDTSFSDARGWGFAQYGPTIMFADIDGDGKADVCGRASDGIRCALSTGSSQTGFKPQFVASEAGNFTDLNDPIQLVNLQGNGPAAVCAGTFGNQINCALNRGNGGFFPATQWYAALVPDSSYDNRLIFSPFNFFNGNSIVCSRRSDGIQCMASDGTPNAPATAFTLLFSGPPEFSNDNKWDSSVTYYGTIQFADINGDGKPDICGRGQAGIFCAIHQ